jgi:hypothetical protein
LNGPGAPEDGNFIQIGVFCFEIVIIWVAFFCLPCSKQKGRPTFDKESEERK